MKTNETGVGFWNRWEGPGRRIACVSALACSAAIGSVLLSGCVSYTNVPAPESAIAFKSANHSQSIRVIRKALAEIVARYPIHDGQGQYAVNLPLGTTLETARSVLEGLPEGGMIPFDGMDDSIPVYSIGRVWIRASDAKVDVVYPVQDYRGGRTVGNATVWLSGGVQPWRIARVQHWAPGTIPEPTVVVPLPKDYQPEAVDGESADEPSDLGEPNEMSQPEAAAPANESDQPKAPQTSGESGSSGGMYRQVPIDD